MKTFLLATDGSKSAVRAQELARDFLSAFPAARLAVVYVENDPIPTIAPPQAIGVVPVGMGVPGMVMNPAPPPDPTGDERGRESWADIIERDTQEYFAPLHLGDRYSYHYQKGHPVEQICAVADEVDADLIIMGSHGHTTFAQAFIGSVSRGVLNHTKRPVLVAR